jgi:hypothetical protein
LKRTPQKGFDVLAHALQRILSWDFSWDRAAAGYEQLYLEAYQLHRGHPFGKT